ncbi:MAG TPA: hypothetical protein VGQ94_07825 [Terriglobales bacterium]|nr:hypothetical protein [Terriglobales bacterium]
MKRRLYLTLVLTVVASLLAIRAITRKQFPSQGYAIAVPLHMKPGACGDWRGTLVLLSKQGSIQINQQTIATNAFPSELQQIYRSRTERVLWVKADPQLDAQEVLTVIDHANSAVPDLQIGLLTPTAEKEPCLAIPFPRRPLPLPEK